VAAVDSALRAAVTDLDAVKAQWALVGGMAVAAHGIPRFTRDIDFAVAVAGDSEAENVVFRLRAYGYMPKTDIEQEYVERMSGVRLVRKGSPVLVDLLFASSGIEAEVVANAARVQVLPRLKAPVAATAHLIALKVLAGRAQDVADLGYLIPPASLPDLDAAREAVRLITARGFNRERDIIAELEQFIADMRRDGGSPR
jgi:hypothetical protein